MNDPESLGAPIAEGGTALIYIWKDGRVFKLFRPWVSPQSIEREYQINAAIAQAAAQMGMNLPVPGQVECIELGERVGILFERVDGPSAADVIFADPSRAVAVVRCMAETQFAYHQLTFDWLPDARDWLSGGIHAAHDIPPPYQAEALNRLAALPGGEALLHGDFHVQNMLLSPRGGVVIDWCNACKGDPLADVARTIVIARVGRPPGEAPKALLNDPVRRAMVNIYLNCYLELSEKTRDDVRAWLLPVAVARWSERIESEQDDLLRLIQEAL
jgi:hypothetical protein